MIKKLLIAFAIIFIFVGMIVFATYQAEEEVGSTASLEEQMAENVKAFPGVDHISPADLADWMQSQNILLIDARSQEEYAVSHIPGAVNRETVDGALSAIRLADSSPDAVVLYGSVGSRSAEVANDLSATGLENIKNLNGSIFRWAIENRPIVDRSGNPTRLIHPYDAYWARFLPEDRRASLSVQR